MAGMTEADAYRRRAALERNLARALRDLCDPIIDPDKGEEAIRAETRARAWEALANELEGATHD